MLVVVRRPAILGGADCQTLWHSMYENSSPWPCGGGHAEAVRQAGAWRVLGEIQASEVVAVPASSAVQAVRPLPRPHYAQVAHRRALFASMRSRRASERWRARFSATFVPVPKYISSGVCPSKAACGTRELCSAT